MKLSDIRGEEAIDILADILEPLTTIMADKEFAEIYRGQKKKEDDSSYTKLDIAQMMLKRYKKEVITVLAILDGESVEDYVEKVTIFTLPMKILEILNDKEMNKLFTSQVQSIEAPSAPVTEITEVRRK